MIENPNVPKVPPVPLMLDGPTYGALLMAMNRRDEEALSAALVKAGWPDGGYIESMSKPTDDELRWTVAGQANETP